MLTLNKKTGIVVIDNVVSSIPIFRKIANSTNGDKILTIVWYVCDHNSQIVKGAYELPDAITKAKELVQLPNFVVTDEVKDAIAYYNENCDGIAGKTLKQTELGLKNISESITVLNRVINLKVKELNKRLEDNAKDTEIVDLISSIVTQQQIIIKIGTDIPNTIDKIVENKSKLKVELDKANKALGGNKVSESMKVH